MDTLVLDGDVEETMGGGTYSSVSKLGSNHEDLLSYEITLKRVFAFSLFPI